MKTSILQPMIAIGCLLFWAMAGTATESRKSTFVKAASPSGMVYKAQVVKLDHDAWYLFDTDLLRTSAWRGSFTDRRAATDEIGQMAGDLLIGSYPAPGVFLNDEQQRDQRARPFGPIQRDQGQFRGIHQAGNKTIFAYSIGSSEVLEQPSASATSISRNLSIGPRKQAVHLVVSDRPGHDVSIAADGKSATTSHAGNGTENPFGKSRNRVESKHWQATDWSALPERSRPEARKATLSAFVAPFVREGGKPGVERADWQVLVDGKFETTAAIAKGTRLLLDLGQPEDVAQLRLLSKSPIKADLYLGSVPAPQASMQHLHEGGWTKLAQIATVLDADQVGMSVTWNPAADLGRSRHVLVVAKAALSLSEVIVLGPRSKKPILPVTADSKPLFVALAADGPVRLVAEEHGRIKLEVPAGSAPINLTLTYADGDSTAATPPQNLSQAIKTPAPSAWSTTLKGRRAPDRKAYVVDDVPLPLDNPFKDPMKLGGFDFFSDGSAAVCTLAGNVWLVKGLDANLDAVTWTRFAGGLCEPLGLAIVNDQVYVHCRDQVMRLQDHNKDGSADFYACFNNQVQVTENYHEFAFDLVADRAGNFYMCKAGSVHKGGRGFATILEHHGKVLRLDSRGEKLEVFASGLRAPNGLAVSADGDIVTTGENEGTYVPACKITWAKKGSYHGVVQTSEDPQQQETAFDQPLCWLPMNVDNSGGGQTWITSKKWGPFEGGLLHLSYGQSAIYVAYQDRVDDVVQGGVCRLPVQSASGAMRGRFHPHDGQYYVVGLRGWQTNAARDGAFQRIRYTGKTPAMPTAIHTVSDGIRITFPSKIDKELAEDLGSYSLQQWNYVYGPMYGSPRVSARAPDQAAIAAARQREFKHHYKQQDKVVVTSATLEADGHSVLLKLAEFQPVMQMEVKVDLEDEDGNEIICDLYLTVHKVPGNDQQAKAPQIPRE